MVDIQSYRANIFMLHYWITTINLAKPFRHQSKIPFISCATQQIRCTIQVLMHSHLSKAAGWQCTLLPNIHCSLLPLLRQTACTSRSSTVGGSPLTLTSTSPSCEKRLLVLARSLGWNKDTALRSTRPKFKITCQEESTRPTTYTTNVKRADSSALNVFCKTATCVMASGI